MPRARRLGWRVWISGASSGIGEELSLQLGARGCDLALFARREERLRALAERLAAASPGIRTVVEAGDVTDRARVGAAVSAARSAFGSLDVVILNAGISDTMAPEDFDAGLVERIIGVNYLGAVYGIEAALPDMLERGTGVIVGVSSIAGERGLPLAAPYCASKAALSTFLQSLRIDLRRRGVRVVTVAPGFIKTPLTERNRFPMPFLQPVEAAASRIIRGIERGKREISFPKRLTVPVKLLGCLPGGVYERAMVALSARGYRKA